MHRVWLWQAAATAFYVREYRTSSCCASAFTLMAASRSNATHTYHSSTSHSAVDFVRHETNGLLMCYLRSPINSTQDEARTMLSTMAELPKTFAVLADIQLKGRGTQGRSWERGIETSDGRTATTDGNLYLTVCIPMASVPATITLLPLQIAVIVAQRVAKLVAAASLANKNDAASTTTTPSGFTVKVKWPNDVLISGHKVSGTLIENEIVQGGQIWMLIGIGVNVLTAPRNIVGKRRAGCLQDHCTDQLAANTAFILGTDIAIAIADWTMEAKKSVDSDEAIVQKWREWADLGQPYELRGAAVDADGHDGEIVTVVDVENDGRLRVRGQDGRMRLLTADYLV